MLGFRPGLQAQPEPSLLALPNLAASQAACVPPLLRAQLQKRALGTLEIQGLALNSVG